MILLASRLGKGGRRQSSRNGGHQPAQKDVAAMCICRGKVKSWPSLTARMSSAPRPTAMPLGLQVQEPIAPAAAKIARSDKVGAKALILE